MSSKWSKSVYVPRNPEKYKGSEKIISRSSWELYMNQFLDNNPNIIEWSSEPFAIPYIKPTTNREHRYFPDYYVKYQNKHGQVVEEIWEVKPKNQVNPPKATRGKSKKTQLHEALTYAINVAKWQSAQKFCNKYGMKFRIITENQLFRN